MALVSDPNPGRAKVDRPCGVRVIDAIDMKESYGIAHAPGVVAVLSDSRPTEPAALVGQTAEIQTDESRRFPARVQAVRDHGTTISLFFRGLTRSDLPIGSIIDLKV